MSMNFIHHVRPSLLRSSTQYPQFILGHEIYRSFTPTPEIVTTQGAEDFIATEEIPEPGPSVLKHPSSGKKVRGRGNKLNANQAHTPLDGQLKPHLFSDKLRSQLEKIRATNEKKNRKTKVFKKPEVVSAAKNAVSLDHARQDDVIRTISHKYPLSKKAKATKEKAFIFPKKMADNETITLLQKLADTMKGPRGVVYSGWGEDGMCLFR
jgi:hypothetical protein